MKAKTQQVLPRDNSNIFELLQNFWINNLQFTILKCSRFCYFCFYFTFTVYIHKCSNTNLLVNLREDLKGCNLYNSKPLVNIKQIGLYVQDKRGDYLHGIRRITAEFEMWGVDCSVWHLKDNDDIKVQYQPKYRNASIKRPLLLNTPPPRE